jgi:hypothetical protein
MEKAISEVIAKQYDLRTPEGQMGEFAEKVIWELSPHSKPDESDPMETLKRLLDEREKLQGRIINANALISDLSGEDIDDALEADLSLRILSWATHVDAFQLAAKLNEHRAIQLEYIIGRAAKEVLSLKVSVTPNTPAYAAVDFARHLRMTEGDSEADTDFDDIIDPE